MADNQLAKMLGSLRLTIAFQTLYTASNSGDGKQTVGTIQLSCLVKDNPIYYDLQIKDGSTYRMIDNRLPTQIGGTDEIPVTLADGQSLQMRVRNAGLPAQINITGATQANPCVLTVDLTVSIDQNDDQVIYISNVGGMTEIIDGEYRITYLTSTTVSLQDMEGNNIDSSAFTTYTSGGTINIVPAHATLHAYEESIPQV